MSKGYIQEIWNSTDYKIIINVANKREVWIITEMLIFLAFDEDSIQNTYKTVYHNDNISKL